MSRAEWILGIILIILLVVVGVLSVMLWFGPEDGGVAGPAGVTVEPTSAQAGQTATTAVALATDTARSWQPDAKLLNITATWPRGIDANTLARGQETWNLTYYSPSAQAVAEIVVLDDGVRLVSERVVDAPLTTGALSSWNLDSWEAVELFMEQGGSNFSRNQASTTLMMRMDTGGEDGRLTWFISLFGNESGASLTMEIDATSGEILTTIAGP